MSGDMMNTKEVAQYLGIHEKQVYALVKAGRIPATRVTGKWIFPKKLIDEWIEANAEQGIKEAKSKSRKISGALLAAGSNDPVLDILQTCMRNSHPEIYIFSANIGSTEGLKALNMGYTDIAWSHLLDAKSGQYNFPYLAIYLPNVRAVVVNLFKREIGFVVAAGNPRNIKSFQDLVNKSIRFINRQRGSGTRLLIDYHLQQRGITPDTISGYDIEVYTHFDVGFSILSGEADVGIASAVVSKLLGLQFIPITWESFDMILDQPTFFEKGLQTFIGVLKSGEFRKIVDRLGGYDFKDSGKILYSAV
ncbi:MAG TPA: substrate-binding domain-containing protein [Syntrophales bacterium]|nr:substrate-binding domain-containing protein [Syntrophales bacterium]